MNEALKAMEMAAKLGIPVAVSVLLTVVLLLFAFIEKRAKNREKLLEETFKKALEMEIEASSQLRETLFLSLQREFEILKGIKQLLKELSAANRELKGALLLLQSDISEVKGMLLKNEIHRR